jgi:L-lactate utilization protein LutB
MRGYDSGENEYIGTNLNNQSNLAKYGQFNMTDLNEKPKSLKSKSILNYGDSITNFQEELEKMTAQVHYK